MPTITFDPEPSLPTAIPANLDPAAQIELIVKLVHAHDRLRQKSVWQTGKLIEMLLAMRARLGVANIKELCAKVDLGMSHMTANKYLRVSRIFDRDTAIATGVEKCYALVLYSKTVGRANETLAILQANDRIHGAPKGVMAQTATAKEIYEAVKTLKAAKKRREEPEQVRLEREAEVAKVETTLGLLGVNVKAAPETRGGEPGYTIWISKKAVGTLDSKIAKTGLPRLVKTWSKAAPHLLDGLRSAGWAPKGRARAPS